MAVMIACTSLGCMSGIMRQAEAVRWRGSIECTDAPVAWRPFARSRARASHPPRLVSCQAARSSPPQPVLLVELNDPPQPLLYAGSIHGEHETEMPWNLAMVRVRSRHFHPTIIQPLLQVVFGLPCWAVQARRQINPEEKPRVSVRRISSPCTQDASARMLNTYASCL